MKSTSEGPREGGGRRFPLWLIPVLLVVSAILFLAWKVADTPGSPFDYDR